MNIPVSVLALLLLLVPVGLAQDAAGENSPLAADFQRYVRLEASVGKGRRTHGGDYDDKTERLTPKVAFTNSSLKVGFEGIKGVMYVIGEGVVNRGHFRLLSVQNVEATILPRGNVTWSGEEILTMYDRTGAAFGEAYQGWVLVLNDADGKNLLVKGNMTNFAKEHTKLAGFGVGDFFDKNLKKVNRGLARPFVPGF